METMSVKQYTQKIINKIGKNKAYSPNDFARAYKEYKKLAGGRTVEKVKVDLLKNPYFIEPYRAKGYFSQFWITLSDMNSYLLKELPDGKFYKQHHGIYTRDNAMLVPKIIKKAGLKSAEYYIVNWVMDDSVDTWEDDFLLTPSFLKDGDEMISFKDIIGQECLDVSLIEKKISRALELRHIKKSVRERFILELKKTLCMFEIVDNTDISMDNMSLIHNNADIRMAPMYDFDFCMGNTATAVKHLKYRGKAGLQAILEYYSSDKAIVKWLKNSVLTINISKLLSEVPKSPNQFAVSNALTEHYKTYWKSRMKLVRNCIERDCSDKELD